MKKVFSNILNTYYPKEKIGDKIPIFSPRTDSERQEDKYDKDFQFIDYYTAYYSYCHITLKYGGSESLYRTINSIVLSHLDRKGNHFFLDVGCGVGRTEYDLAELYPNSQFVGIDYAYRMLERASQILFSGKDVKMDLSNNGFGELIVPGKKLTNNVTLAQADAMDLPFKKNSFDCVINTFLVDRLPEPKKAITESIEALKPGGLCIFTNPLNHLSKELWKELGTFDKVVSFIKQSGIEIIEAFDNLAYKQLIDARGNYREWKTIVIYGIKS